MSVLQEIQHDIEGVRLLNDWLGDGGKPVHQMAAEFRAQRCLMGNNGKPCHLNVEPNWWDKAKGVIAATIRMELGLKNRMNLRVQGEKSLNMCKICGCCLRLKVHTPIQHVHAHLTPEQFKELPAWCWMQHNSDMT